MGRPRELTEEERAELTSEGYRPVQLWVRRRDDVFWREVLDEAREIGRAEDEADFDLFIEGAAQDTFRLIDEMEQNAQDQDSGGRGNG